jgi:hypothetical protein
MPVGPSPSPKSPIYTSAFICNSILKDSEGILTAIRIADIFKTTVVEITIPGQGDLKHLIQLYPPINVAAIVSFRSESPVEFEMRFQGRSANGELLPGVHKVPIKMQGGVDGYIMNIALNLDGELYGDIWFEIFVDDELATKIPFRIIREPAVSGRTNPDLDRAEETKN